MSSQKPFQSKIFVPSARAFRTLYMNIVGFKSDHIAVYDTIYHYWNVDYGYAFPPAYKIQLETGYGETHVRKLIGDLVKWDLIEVLSNPNGDNKTYNLIKPIEEESAFYRKFPDARAEGEARYAKAMGRASRPKRSKRTKKAAEDIPLKPLATPPTVPTYGVPTREDLDKVFAASAEESSLDELMSFL
ncbi:hypothetical protein [Paenibacillus odorifer]|uniref:hypothetical protein n=1 Tax=Paenibacillus odorifer TaxID=189426 RepID=UPI000B9FA8FD|nr:hypothetical protein [Paenibacillus odorifer]OZQ66547.1 hypothetical protein CA596_27380 [Paenibacillus odorifer]